MSLASIWGPVREGVCVYTPRGWITDKQSGTGTGRRHDEHCTIPFSRSGLEPEGPLLPRPRFFHSFNPSIMLIHSSTFIWHPLYAMHCARLD